mgnify:CR=1 FL=1
MRPVEQAAYIFKKFKARYKHEADEFKKQQAEEKIKFDEKIAKLLKDSGPKSLKTQIQGEELRVSSKSRDDLQTAIAQVKKESWDFAVQFTNYR